MRMTAEEQARWTLRPSVRGEFGKALCNGPGNAEVTGGRTKEQKGKKEKKTDKRLERERHHDDNTRPVSKLHTRGKKKARRAWGPACSTLVMPESSASDSKMASGSCVARAHRFSCLRPRSCSGSAGEWPEKRYVWT